MDFEGDGLYSYLTIQQLGVLCCHMWCPMNWYLDWKDAQKIQQSCCLRCVWHCDRLSGSESWPDFYFKAAVVKKEIGLGMGGRSSAEKEEDNPLKLLGDVSCSHWKEERSYLFCWGIKIKEHLHRWLWSNGQALGILSEWRDSSQLVGKMCSDRRKNTWTEFSSTAWQDGWPYPLLAIPEV